MAYIGGDQVLLFGGLDMYYSVLGGTWLFDQSDATWTQLSPATSPSARYGHAMAYIGGDQVLLFGGVDASFSVVGDTWVFDLQENGAVQLADFRARRSGRSVVLGWETAGEIKHAGFRVLREEPDGQFTNLTLRLIPPNSTGGELGGAHYSFTDSAAPRAATRYWLEDVDTLGNATRHGPALAPPYRARPISLPVPPGGATDGQLDPQAPQAEWAALPEEVLP
jgi:hypothetical protein